MVVSWIPLSYSEARGFVSHYTVTYFRRISGRKRQSLVTLTKTVPGMDFSTATVVDLDPDTEYDVSVSATNGAETSDPSATAVLGTYISEYHSSSFAHKERGKEGKREGEGG